MIKEIYKGEFIEILKKNFGYEVVDTKLGKAIKVPSREAFIYSTITGAGYLDNPIYPFTPKGLMKLFYNAFNFQFVSGIFDNGVVKNTPYLFSKIKPYLFRGDKYIVPVEFETETMLSTYLSEKVHELETPEDYIIQRIEVSKKGNGMEPFMEFLAGEFFRNQGYIVETQIPLAHSIGSPDFAGYGLTEVITEISKAGYLSAGGFHMIELTMIRNFGPQKDHYKDQNNRTNIVGDAKTGSYSAASQIEKYLNTGLFDAGFEIYPFANSPTKKHLGLVSLREDFSVSVSHPVEEYQGKRTLSHKDYLVWLELYVRFHLLANFTNDELKSFYKKYFGRSLNGKDDLVEFVKELKVTDILRQIKEL